MENNLKCIMSPHLAKILINKGFVVKDIKPDRDIKNATIFLFENSEELNSIVDEYKKERIKRKLT